MEPADIRVGEHYPLELHYIKAVFLEKQYRQCIQTCRDVLSGAAATEQPLYHAFTRFYLALAHDELARAIHQHSRAKVPAFDQAEQLYQATLASLPTAEACRSWAGNHGRAIENDNFSDTSPNTASSRINAPRHNSTPSSPPAILSPPLSPPTHIRNNSLPTRSPGRAMSASGGSEYDDLESHESFNEIMTPTRLPKLERDYSSMSLLQPLHRHAPQALMRPVRPGSIARPYQVPPPSLLRTTSKPLPELPKIDTSPTSSTQRKQLRSPSEQVSPVESPVSPLGSAGIGSDTSTLSPVSPDTPTGGTVLGTPMQNTEQPSAHEIRSHLAAFQAQLETHMDLLQKARKQAMDFQTTRASTRAAKHKAGRLGNIIDVASRKSDGLSQSRSYWSFTPEDQKVLEKQKRIEAGRSRGWTRKKAFDPSRYRALSEKALAEL